MVLTLSDDSIWQAKWDLPSEHGYTLLVHPSQLNLAQGIAQPHPDVEVRETQWLQHGQARMIAKAPPPGYRIHPK